MNEFLFNDAFLRIMLNVNNQNIIIPLYLLYIWKHFKGIKISEMFSILLVLNILKNLAVRQSSYYNRRGR